MGTLLPPQDVLVKDSESRVINGPQDREYAPGNPHVIGRAVDLTPYAEAVRKSQEAQVRPSDELQRLVDAAKGRAVPRASAEDVARKDPLLAERGKTHGNWAVNAGVSQAIKEIMRKECGTLPAPLQEALDVICTKLGRIAAGDALFYDHWKDIAGYAKLAEAYCDELRPRDGA